MEKEEEEEERVHFCPLYFHFWKELQTTTKTPATNELKNRNPNQNEAPNSKLCTAQAVTLPTSYTKCVNFNFHPQTLSLFGLRRRGRRRRRRRGEHKKRSWLDAHKWVVKEEKKGGKKGEERKREKCLEFEENKTRRSPELFLMTILWKNKCQSTFRPQ